MNIAAGLSTALAVFIGVDAAVIVLMLWPPRDNPGATLRTHGGLLALALVALIGLSLISGNG